MSGRLKVARSTIAVPPVAIPLPPRDAVVDVPTLLSPFRVGSMTLRNRVVLSPMGSNMAAPDGSVSDTLVAYYEQRARGGTGLVIVENSSVSGPVGTNGTTHLRIDHDRYLPRLWELTERLHYHGAKVALQLNHAGAVANPARTGAPAVSPSGLPPRPGAPDPTPLDRNEIAAIVADFGAAAARAKRAGFDAVEVHAGHAYLLAQFLSPRWNRRDDEYGDGPEGRARIVREVLSAVRGSVGRDFPVMVRVSADEPDTGGNTPASLLELVAQFVAEVDLLDVSGAPGGSLAEVDRSDPPYGAPSSLAVSFRERFGVPTIASGGLRDPAAVEALLAAGGADLVAIGRGLIADPWWTAKVASGRVDTIVECIACNTGCADHRSRLDRPIRCAINPDIVGHESYARRRVTRPTRVVVVGGGVAGLEAASTAAEVGCDVVLLEERNVVGGMFGESVKLEAKRRMATFVDHLARRAARAGVDVHIGTAGAPDTVAELKPDLVVSATGSRPLIPPIAGLRERIDVAGSGVRSVLALTSNLGEIDALAGRDAVVVGGGAVGLDVVEACLAAGARVTLVERMPAVGSDLDVVAMIQVRRMLASSRVRVLLDTSLVEVGDGWVRLRTADGRDERIECAASFVCLGMRSTVEPYDALVERFAGTGVDLMNIGDAARVGKVIDAVREGRSVLAALERRGVLAI